MMCVKQVLSPAWYVIIVLFTSVVAWANPVVSFQNTAFEEAIDASVVAQEALGHARELGKNVLHRTLSGNTGEDLYPHRFLSFKQCMNDTEKLFNDNPELDNAAEQVIEDFDEELDKECGNLTEGTVCIVDDDDLPSAPAYVEACRAAGGTIYEYNVRIQCEVQQQEGEEDANLVFRLHLENMDSCTDASSCDPNEVASELELIVDETLENEVEFTAGAFQVTCDSNVTFLKSSAMSLFTSYFPVPFISCLAGFMMSVTIGGLLF